MRNGESVTLFAGFASGQPVQLQQMNFGLAVAVFPDATVLRGILVPAPALVTSVSGDD